MDTEKMDSLRSMVDALGLDRAEVAAMLAAEPTGSGGDNHPLLGDFIDTTLALTKSAGTKRGYITHWKRLRHGVGPQCTCTCDACLDQFAQHECCRCECATCAAAVSFTAMGDVPLKPGRFTRTGIEPLVIIAGRMSAKKAHLDNAKRAKKGLPPKVTHGQGGQEMCVCALRHLFGRAVDDELLSTNPAARLEKGERSESKRRALTLSEMEDLFDEAVNGGDDPALDFAICWTLLETAGRKTGLLESTVGSILAERQTMRLLEKGNRVREQPISAELIDYLLAMAADRGGSRCVSGDPEFDPKTPLFYYADSTPTHPHPLTSKRFETLFGRIQRRFAWAAEMQFSAHALRHTTATLIERRHGTQVARKYLGHGKRKPTDIYTDATEAELATAMVSITGFAHPNARIAET